METGKSFRYAPIVIALMLAGSAYVWLQTPDATTFQIVWTSDGAQNPSLPKPVALLAVPLLTTLASVIIGVAARIDPRQDHLLQSRQLLATAWLGTLGLFSVVHTRVLASALGYAPPLARALPLTLSLFLILWGDVIGKSRSNFTVGMRTPWTLHSELAWGKTNRAAGRLFFALGIVGAVAAFALNHPYAILLLLAGSIFILLFSVLYSYLIWRGDTGRMAL